MDAYSEGLNEGLSDDYAKGYSQCISDVRKLIDDLYLDPRVAYAEFEGEVDKITWDDQVDGAQIALIYLKSKIKTPKP